MLGVMSVLLLFLTSGVMSNLGSTGRPNGTIDVYFISTSYRLPRYILKTMSCPVVMMQRTIVW